MPIEVELGLAVKSLDATETDMFHKFPIEWTKHPIYTIITDPL